MVNSKLKQRLRKVSEERESTMSAVLEDLLQAHLPETDLLDVGPGKGKAWVRENAGVLKGRLKMEDWERKDRFSELLRKHAPR